MEWARDFPTVSSFVVVAHLMPFLSLPFGYNFLLTQLTWVVMCVCVALYLYTLFYPELNDYALVPGYVIYYHGKPLAASRTCERDLCCAACRMAAHTQRGFFPRGYFARAVQYDVLPHAGPGDRALTGQHVPRWFNFDERVVDRMAVLRHGVAVVAGGK